MLSAPIPSNIRENNAVVIQCGLLILIVVFRHTSSVPQELVNTTYMILLEVCQAFFNCTLNIFIECVKPPALDPYAFVPKFQMFLILASIPPLL